MKVAIVNYYYNIELDSPDEVLDQYLTLTGWAEGLRRAGAMVTVFLRYKSDAVLERNGITYHFISDQFGQMLRLWQIPLRLHRAISKASHDIVHINSFLFPTQSFALSKILSRNTAFVIQNHAEKPWNIPKLLIQYILLYDMDGFIFTTKEQAHSWIKARIIDSIEKVYPVMEGSTLFLRRDRQSCRTITKFKGNPIFLWVGRLDGNKDPITVLKGFDLALEKIPNAKLYMIYSTSDLLSMVNDIINKSERLKGAVELLGPIVHAEMEYYYNSADYYLLGSHYEGSGYALVESLACGVVPIITDIPSFRMMTDDGKIGGLWQVGDHAQCAKKIVEVTARPLNKLSEAAYRYYLEHLSFNAIGRGALEIYERILIGR